VIRWLLGGDRRVPDTEGIRAGEKTQCAPRTWTGSVGIRVRGKSRGWRYGRQCHRKMTEAWGLGDDLLRTMSPRAIRRYFHPLFCESTSQTSGEGGQECCGRTKRATTADRTAPKEKNTESAVTRYCLDLGMCSSSSVPSVGIEPYQNDQFIGKTKKQSTYTNSAPQEKQDNTQHEK
jgi:hypothetical protein